MNEIFERLPSEERELLCEESFPDWLDPMLATLTHDHFSDPEWLFERKLDGERVLAYRSEDRVRLVSRNGTELGDTYPELHDAVGRASSLACILDGRSTRDLPLRARKSLLRATVAFDDPSRWVPHRNEDGALRYAGKVGTGYDQQTLEHLGGLLEQRERRTSPFDDGPGDTTLHFVTPDLVAEVGFTEWTHDGRLRHPRYLGLRDDKDPQEVVRETPS